MVAALARPQANRHPETVDLQGRESTEPPPVPITFQSVSRGGIPLQLNEL